MVPGSAAIQEDGTQHRQRPWATRSVAELAERGKTGIHLCTCGLGADDLGFFWFICSGSRTMTSESKPRQARRVTGLPGARRHSRSRSVSRSPDVGPLGHLGEADELVVHDLRTADAAPGTAVTGQQGPAAGESARQKAYRCACGFATGSVPVLEDHLLTFPEDDHYELAPPLR
jgi:hypothetical protein